MHSPRYFAWLVLVVMAIGLYGEHIVVEQPQLIAQVMRVMRRLQTNIATIPCGR